MPDLSQGLTALLLGSATPALFWLAYFHPSAYHRIYVVMRAVAALSLAAAAGWNAAVTHLARELLPAMTRPKANSDLIDVVAGVMLPGWLLAAGLGVLLVLALLDGFPIFGLTDKDRRNGG